MRTIFILRGAPASGKSTWIKKNELDSYTISTDTLRLMYQSPVTTTTGEREISQNHDKEVWKMVLDLMEQRMKNGEFIIVDATHYKAPLINRYKELITKYRYRAYVVDFSDIPEELLIERNKHRGFRKVPDEVISKMCVALKDDSEVKKSYKIITPEEAINMINSPLVPFDANNYEKIVVFGDIHGCYEPLKEYFENNPFNENYNYIFCGDYLDRGLQNKEVLEFLLTLKDKTNVLFLEGNHEKWLRLYADKNYNMDYYESKNQDYKDPFVSKIVSQLNDKIIQLTNKIKKNKNKAEELSRLLKEAWETNPETRDVYYEFELINVPETQKQLNSDNKKYENQLEILKKYLYSLQHEEQNTNNLIVLCKVWYEDTFNSDLSLNITNILEKKYNVIRNNKENPITSLEFIKRTYPQIKNIDKTEIRRFCDRLAQMSYITYNDRNYFICHGGLPCLPTIKTQTIEMIKGVGKYEEHEHIDSRFAINTPLYTFQIHGHRNTMKVPHKDDVIFNLEGQVEFGGSLRILEITKNGEHNHHECIEIKNNNFIQKEQEQVIEEKSDIELLKEMYHSKWVQVKNLKDNIISLNFTRDAFEKGKWNNLTNQARGLFVDKTNGKVVARSFEKFFNYKEQPCTEAGYMKEHIKYPLIGYKKENGYLGIISKYNGEVRFFTKSTDQGDFVNWFKGILCDWYDIKHKLSKSDIWSYTSLYNLTLKEDIEETQLQWCKARIDELETELKAKLSPLIAEGYSYVFEVIDIFNDPHIIKYKENRITLLEVFKNQLREEHIDWKHLHEVADRLCVPCKELELRFDNWEEFEKWKEKFHSGITQWDCKHEGYVFEDANGYRVKFKSSFYKFWKQMRALKQIIQSGKTNRKIYKTKEEIEVVKLLESIDKEQLKKMSIIDIQEIYYNNVV